MDQLFPQTAVNMVKVLRKAGCEVIYNPNQTCCGQPAFNAGHWDQARPVAEKFLRDFKDAEVIVCPSGSCTGFVKNYYKKLFEGTDKEKFLKEIKLNIFELTEFLVEKLGQTNFGAKLEAKATYHDGCGSLRECGIKSAPRKLLENVEGLELIEAPDCETCCGFGGTFSIKYEPISIAMAEQKVENAIATGAEYILSGDQSCLLQIQSYIDKKNYTIKTLHIADVLAMF